MPLFPRITTNPAIISGKPCIRGMRVTVNMIVQARNAGRTPHDLLTGFPYLEEAALHEAPACTAHLAQARDTHIAN